MTDRPSPEETSAERLVQIGQVFTAALAGTDDAEPIVERTREAMRVMPLSLVEELHDLTVALEVLLDEEIERRRA